LPESEFPNFRNSDLPRGSKTRKARNQFALAFTTEGGKVLRLRMPWDGLANLGKLLLDLGAERRLHGDV